MSRLLKSMFGVFRSYRRLRGARSLGVRALVLDGRGRVALVLHTYIDDWYLPGGGVDRRESFAEALTRELDEEIGLTEFTIERVLGVYHDRIELKDDHVVVFVVRTITPEAQIRAADGFEIEQAGWFPLDDLPPDLSPATARRIADYKAAATGLGPW
jgi:8-oxo-dGTP pyrophosphatase MutT (NUDIX family)